jgi:hypothetical protein
MAVAKTVTKLKLDQFARIMGINPLHFNQVHLDGYEAQVCGEPIYQYSWQNADRVGREELAQAIADAERLIEDNLFYYILPTYTLDERNSIDPRLARATVRTKNGYFLSGGVRVISSVSAGVAITYSAADPLGYKRTGSITIAVPFTDPEEVAIYYPGHNKDEAWRIEPISVTIVAGVATIVVPRERMVIESELETLAGPNSVEGTDNSKFLTTVDVARDYLDPSQQAAFLWQNRCACGGVSGCLYSSQTGCIRARDYENGIVTVTAGDWDAVNGVYTSPAGGWCSWPETVRLWYRSGWQDKSLTWPTRTLDEQWARAVSYLAVTMLDRPLCGCNSLEKITQYYAVDLLLETNEERFNVRTNKTVQDNPIGSQRGAINAWRLIQQRMLGQGVISV